MTTAADRVVGLQERIDRVTAQGPLIQVRGGELPRVVADAERALIDASAGIFQRGGQLVRVAQLEKATEGRIRRAAGAPIIIQVTREWLQLALGRAARFERWIPQEKKFAPADAPSAVAGAIISRAGEWNFPPLAGIVSAPTLREDGSLLSAPGYDVDSQLFAAFDPASFPTIDPRPSREAAINALDTLFELFKECAFVGGDQSEHGAAAIASLITAVNRSALPTAPASAVSARKAGSGKTTLAQAIAQIALGREPPVVPAADDEDEVRKALLATLLSGDGAVIFDNVEKPLASAALCAALTSPTYGDRLLGASQKITVPTRCTWFITGNHLELVGDLTSRAILVALDPEVENPESRPFSRDLGEYVREHRGELVAAALTVPLAYLAVDAPKPKARRSRFAAWDRLVRYPLLWLGIADPLKTQDELRGTDPIREALVALLSAWREAFESEAATVSDAIAAATSPGQSANPAMFEAVHAVAGERNGEINARRFGRYLARNVRRIESGMRFEQVGFESLTKRPKYRVGRVG